MSGEYIVRFLCCLLLALPASGRAAEAFGEAASDPSIKTYIEVLSRMNPKLYQQSPKVRQLVDRSLSALEGQPEFIDLAIRFGITNRTALLVTTANQFPRHPSSVRAIGYLLDIGAAPAIQKHLQQNPNVPLLSLLSRTASTQAIDLAMPFLFGGHLDPPTTGAVLSALCRQKEGAKRVLQALERASFEEVAAIARQAADIVKQTPWSEIQGGFEKLLPPPAAAQAEASPKGSEWIGLKGDAKRGRAVFRQAQNTCVNCHRAESAGKDIGPDLSEIGKKLGKDALYEAILNPSAGISLGYEGWEITLASGEEFSGILLNEQTEQLTMRNLAGESVAIPKANIFEKRRMAVSIMPEGLEQVIGREDLVHLVEYLSQLGR